MAVETVKLTLDDYRRYKRIESAAKKLSIEVHNAVLHPEWFSADSQAVRSNLLTWSTMTTKALEPVPSSKSVVEEKVELLVNEVGYKPAARILRELADDLERS